MAASKRRHTASLLAAVALVTGCLQAVDWAWPAWACACGAPATEASNPDGDVLIGEEYAIISSSEGREQIDLRLSLETVAQDSGLIFPTPAPAKVALGDLQDFSAVAEQTAPQKAVLDEWWGMPALPGTGGAGDAGGDGAQDGRPVILDEVQLGPLRATTLEASDTAGLTAWLEENGFAVRPVVEPLLRGYIAKGWYFVTLKLTNPDGLGGTIDPLRFTFDLPADGLAYPLALSQAARVRQRIMLYVFGDHRHDVAWVELPPDLDDAAAPADPATPVDLLAGATPYWTGPVDHPDLLEFGDWLTVFDLSFFDPGEQIRGDLVFPQSEQDREIRVWDYQTVSHSFLGFGLGWWAVAVGIMLVTGVPVLVGLRLDRARRRKAFASRMGA
ncbi:MAG: DUF2330 domain-containing protein [Bifidobacteriaceae bacterium]|jgi:hypothetical protein|nr:DUF2330 domain-containing protein [Bifidobacteriaceae bacterium]